MHPDENPTTVSADPCSSSKVNSAQEIPGSPSIGKSNMDSAQQTPGSPSIDVSTMNSNEGLDNALVSPSAMFSNVDLDRDGLGELENFEYSPVAESTTDSAQQTPGSILIDISDVDSTEQPDNTLIDNPTMIPAEESDNTFADSSARLSNVDVIMASIAGSTQLPIQNPFNVPIEASSAGPVEEKINPFLKFSTGSGFSTAGSQFSTSSSPEDSPNMSTTRPTTGSDADKADKPVTSRFFSPATNPFLDTLDTDGLQAMTNAPSVKRSASELSMADNSAAMPPAKKPALEGSASSHGFSLSPQPAVVTTTFDKHGDLTLVVGPGRHVFIVCSRTLARACWVWDTMLYGLSDEGQSQHKEKDWTFTLTQDDARALAIVLHILHGNFDNVPESINIKILFDLAVLADKYDLVRPLSEYWYGWTNDAILPFTSHLTFRDDQKSLNRILFVLYVLGFEKRFREVLLGVIANVSLGDDGKLRLTGHERLSMEDNVFIKRLDIIEPIKEARKKMLSCLSTAVSSGLDSLIAGTKCGSQGHIAEPHHDTCDSALLGEFYKRMGMSREKWDREKIKSLQQSKKSVASLLRLFNTRRSNIKGYSKVRDLPGRHKKCEPWADMTMKELMDAAEVEKMVPINHAYFEERAEMAGTKD
ncbi:hypothetical protein B0T24DRAFT_672204 [Lasiosphaeria ovina]|uniref:BTB domain-containing protein n=1 Tax=Lasiosphaeria ovina TaxID=92902 RepID=A0AAE0TWL1_9PEZI|nr:hypothetical protein B0T24DRAFT_672204 [Lasiosphaeria ovina]